MDRAKAKRLGLKRYDGSPCPNGHGGRRYTVNGDCVDCAPAKFARFAHRSETYRQTRRDKYAAGGTDKDWLLRYRYGISLAEYQEMLAAQSGKCAICGGDGGTKALHIDHCHETGRVRGLICFMCNSGLGMFNDDPARLAAALVYLGRARGR